MPSLTILIRQSALLTPGSFITEKDVYDRNHGPIPHVDADSHILHVDGDVVNELKLTVGQLQHEFQHHEVICALQCAGNRRHTMRTLLKEVEGIDWGDGAVMNCVWKGPRLRDILLHAGVNTSGPKQAHVAFASFQVKCQEDDWYGASIELGRALRADGDVVIALEVRLSAGMLKDAGTKSFIDEWPTATCQAWLSLSHHCTWHCRGTLRQMAGSYHRTGS